MPAVSRETRKTSRLEWVDYAKGLAIILVVYRHALYGIKFSGFGVQPWLMNANEIVYSFRMPLFFILSGFFVSKSIAKRDVLGQFSKYKFNTILYPYLIWGFIQISLQIALSNYTNSSRTLYDFVLLLLQPRAIDQLWYLYALFNVSILFFVLHKTLKLDGVWLLGISLVTFALSTYVKEFSLIHDTLYFLLFFSIGHIARKIFLEERYSNRLYSIYLLVAITPIFFLTQYYWLSNREMNLFLFAAVSLIGVLFTFNLSFILSKHQAIPIVKLVGRYSLQVYLMHVLVIAATRILLTKIFGISSTEVLLLTCWVAGTVIPVLIYHRLKSTNFKFLFTLASK